MSRGPSATRSQWAANTVGTAIASQRSSVRDVSNAFMTALELIRRVPCRSSMEKVFGAPSRSHEHVGKSLSLCVLLFRSVTRGPRLRYANGVMGMPNILRKVLLLDLLQGLKVTFMYQDPKENYTEQYPLERPQVAERYRGAPRLNVNPDTDETMCIACDLCALACPEHLIVVSSERNEKTRRKELTNFTYDLSRCMFCGLCEDACPTDALELTQDFELANYSREDMIWDRETLEKGPRPTVYKK